MYCKVRQLTLAVGKSGEREEKWRGRGEEREFFESQMFCDKNLLI
jgi:hypothetical protein